jgi:dTDP-4-amino-4,6-dideoxygalactose transaminase
MPDTILQCNPRADYLAHKREIDAAIEGVLEAGSYILGQQVAAFEQEFSAYLGVGHAVGVGNGTDALHLALRACGVGRGDAVITVSHTAVATVAAIELVAAEPILVDIDSITLTMDPNRLEAAIKNSRRRRVKAVIPVHLYGQPADLSAILEIAKRYDLYVIEDCAQSHGASWEGRKTGAWGHMATFSFYPTKNLAALGDGGAIVTNDLSLADKSRQLREYGWRDRYVSLLPGLNSRLDELQAAVLRVKLRYLDAANLRRQALARLYDCSLQAQKSVQTPSCGKGLHVYHQYVVRSPERQSLKSYLQSNGISTLIHYPVPVHLQPAYKDRLTIGIGGLGRSEEACQKVLSLPMHSHLADHESLEVCEMLKRWADSRENN